MQSQDNEGEIETQNAIKSDRIKLAMGAVIFVVIVITASSIIYLAQSHDKVGQAGLNSEVLQTDPSPTSTAVPLVKQKYTLELLNASGEAGLAGLAKDELLGSQTESSLVELEISVGNAPSQSGNTIIYKSEQLKRSPLASVLAGEWSEATIEVDPELEFEARVIIGR